jgi:hypothetical protein
MGVRIMWTVGMVLIGLILGFGLGRLWEMRQQFLREDRVSTSHFQSVSRSRRAPELE